MPDSTAICQLSLLPKISPHLFVFVFPFYTMYLAHSEMFYIFPQLIWLLVFTYRNPTYSSRPIFIFLSVFMQISRDYTFTQQHPLMKFVEFYCSSSHLEDSICKRCRDSVITGTQFEFQVHYLLPMKLGILIYLSELHL